MCAQETEESSHTDATEYWTKLWNTSTTPWHEQNVNSFLLRHADELIDNREHIRIFVPLCGKTVDMKWLADKGHTVVGLDCSHLALESFFNEHALEFTTEPVNRLNGVLYKSTTLSISLYCCNVMEFDKANEERFDAVWDHGSLVAVRLADIPRYVEVIRSLMTDDCRYLLETVDYDKKLYDGPPNSFADADVIQELFGDHFCCRKLSTEEDEEKHKRIAPQSQHFNLHCWIITRK